MPSVIAGKPQAQVVVVRRGPRVRRFIAGIAFGIGMAQSLLGASASGVVIGADAIAAQVAVDEYGITAATFIVVSLSLLVTAKHRRLRAGRLVAGVGCVAFLVFGTTFWPFALTGVTTYGLVGLFLAAEAIRP